MAGEIFPTDFNSSEASLQTAGTQHKHTPGKIWENHS